MFHLNHTPHDDSEVRWVDNIGERLIERVSFEIGGIEVACYEHCPKCNKLVNIYENLHMTDKKDQMCEKCHDELYMKDLLFPKPSGQGYQSLFGQNIFPLYLTPEDLPDSNP